MVYNWVDRKVDKSGRVLEYVLVDTNGGRVSVKTADLKKAIVGGKVTVSNLTLSSNGKLIPKRSEAKTVKSAPTNNTDLQAIIASQKQQIDALQLELVKCKTENDNLRRKLALFLKGRDISEEELSSAEVDRLQLNQCMSIVSGFKTSGSYKYEIYKRKSGDYILYLGCVDVYVDGNIWFECHSALLLSEICRRGCTVDVSDNGVLTVVGVGVGDSKVVHTLWDGMASKATDEYKNKFLDGAVCAANVFTPERIANLIWKDSDSNYQRKWGLRDVAERKATWDKVWSKNYY